MDVVKCCHHLELPTAFVADLYQRQKQRQMQTTSCASQMSTTSRQQYSTHSACTLPGCGIQKGGEGMQGALKQETTSRFLNLV